VDAIGALSTAELAKSIGVEPQSSSSSSGKGGKAIDNVKTSTATSLPNNNTERGSKKELNSAGSSASLDTGSGSDSEGVIDVAHKQSSSTGSGASGKSGSSSSSSSSSSSGGSSSGDNSPSSSSSAGSSGSEKMGPVRIVSTTESSSASGASSGGGGGSSSDGNDGLSSTALTRFTAGKGQSGRGGGKESPSQSGLDGWRANLEQRRARGRLTETEKKARERAILALSLNFPSAASATSSSSSNGIQPLFAIISLAGKQFKVSPGDIVVADRLKNVAVATELALSPHIVGSPTTTIVGRPVVQGATVMCVVESHELDEKVIVFKKKRRKRYQRTQGHRREISRIRIDKIVCDVAAY